MTKTIVVIGAGPGVGLAVAECFGREGYQVALVARNIEKLKGLTSKLEAQGITAAAFHADILDRESLTKALEQVKCHFGNINMLEFSPVSSVDLIHTPRNIDIENILFQMNFQVLSAITIVQKILPDMLQQRMEAYYLRQHLPYKNLFV